MHGDFEQAANSVDKISKKSTGTLDHRKLLSRYGFFQSRSSRCRGVASFARSGGGQNWNQGAKIFAEMRRLFLAEITSFPTKSRWSPIKKKVFAQIRRVFLAEMVNLNVFSAQKHQLLPPKKIQWGGKKKIGGAKTKIGGAKMKIGGHSPPLPPRWRRAWVVVMKSVRIVR